MMNMNLAISQLKAVAEKHLMPVFLKWTST